MNTLSSGFGDSGFAVSRLGQWIPNCGFRGSGFRGSGFEVRGWDLENEDAAETHARLALHRRQPCLCLDFGVWGWGLGCRVLGVWGLGFGVWGLGFGV